MTYIFLFKNGIRKIYNRKGGKEGKGRGGEQRKGKRERESREREKRERKEKGRKRKGAGKERKDIVSENGERRKGGCGR